MARRNASADAAPVEIIEDAGGPELGIDFGIIVGTTIVLLGAVILVLVSLADHYGRGPLS